MGVASQKCWKAAVFEIYFYAAVHQTVYLFLLFLNYFPWLSSILLFKDKGVLIERTYLILHQKQIHFYQKKLKHELRKQ